jgi:ABC-2 type transport system ATP-binding protein
VEASLRRLGVEAIDLHQAHCWDPATPIEETLETYADLVRAGKVRYVGVSNFTGWQLQRAIVSARHRGAPEPVTLHGERTAGARVPLPLHRAGDSTAPPLRLADRRRAMSFAAPGGPMNQMTTQSTLAIEATGLVKSFGKTLAVDGVDLAVRSGSVYGVLGPNGAGKTTTIRMLATLLRPDAGSARVLGHDIVSEAEAVRGLVSLTGQLASVDEDLTGRENLILLGRLLGLKRAAANIVVTPQLMFLDEPTTGLDPRSRNQVWDIIRALVAEGTTILLCTQYLDEADHLADGIAVIDRGKVIAEGTPGQLKASVGSGALRVRLLDPEQRPEAERVLGRELDSVHLEPDPAALSAPCADGNRAAEAVAELTRAGVRVADFSLGQPTLDEVFLALTGRPAEEQQAA